MGISDLSVFQALKTKMQWHQERQRVLSENVANSDTPGFVARDLKAPEFSDPGRRLGVARVSQAVTRAGHMQAPNDGGFGKGAKSAGFEITPDGNSVVLEEQMMKVTANQMDYQAATTLYSRGLDLLKTAIGKR